MAELATQDEVDVDDAPLLKHRRIKADEEIDITPMIDCTFQLLIFFIVCSIPDPQRAMSLAQAAHGVTISPSNAVVVTLIEGPGRTAHVYLGDGREGEPLPDNPEAQREALLQHFQAGVTEGKTIALTKAEGGIKGSDTRRVTSVLGEVEGLLPHLAVADKTEDD